MVGLGCAFLILDKWASSAVDKFAPTNSGVSSYADFPAALACAWDPSKSLAYRIDVHFYTAKGVFGLLDD